MPKLTFLQKLSKKESAYLQKVKREQASGQRKAISEKKKHETLVIREQARERKKAVSEQKKRERASIKVQKVKESSFLQSLRKKERAKARSRKKNIKIAKRIWRKLI